MPRRLQEIRVKNIHRGLLKMADLVEKQIYESMLCLKRYDLEKCDIIVAADDRVDELQKFLEEECIKFIATEQPLASDLRKVFAASKIVTDLERIADYAVDICKITKKLDGSVSVFKDEIDDLWEMEKKVRSMIAESIKSYINDDENSAYNLCEADNEVDKLYTSLFSKIIRLIQEDEKNICKGSKLLFVIKYLERAADHITNICEWTIFSVKGVYVDLNE